MTSSHISIPTPMSQTHHNDIPDADVAASTSVTVEDGVTANTVELTTPFPPPQGDVTRAQVGKEFP